MIIDTASNTTSQLIHLQADKVTTVIRYLTSTLGLRKLGATATVRALGLTLNALQGSYKLVTPAEAKALANASIKLGLVFENGGGSPGYDDINSASGSNDAEFSLDYIPTLEAPADGSVCVYFACDNDFSATQIQQLVLPYFESIAQRFDSSSYLIGVYGSGAVCQAVCSEGLATYAWLSGSLGWTNSRTYFSDKPKELVLVQNRMDITLANMNVDTDIQLGPFGDFLAAA